MAKRMLQNTKSFERNPVVRFSQMAGSTFKGRLIGSSETKFGLAFKFAVIEGDAPIQIKDGKDQPYHDVEVAVGDPVNVLTSKDGQLETFLKQVQVGEVAEIKFLGKVLNPKTGRQFNNFQVGIDE